VDAVVCRILSLIYSHPEVSADVGIVKAHDFLSFQFHADLLHDRSPKVINDCAVGIFIAVQHNVKCNACHCINTVVGHNNALAITFHPICCAAK